MSNLHGQEPIAITGMAVRLPGARTATELWRNIVAGTEAVQRFSGEELVAAGVSRDLVDHPRYVPWGTVLDGIDQFDTDFFGFSNHEAKITDPQHRVFLQTCWEALEDAALVPSDHTGRIGVFAATTLSSYLLNNIQRNARHRSNCLNYPLLIGNDKDFLATRVGFKIGLTGPALTVQSACSGSLVAIHVAARALRAGDTDAALVGGVSIVTPQTAGYLHEEGGILSRDGHCRPFDKDASGTVRGTGCGVVVLKRLADALADRDHIYALVAGSAINNDGSDKMGYAAPSVGGQAAVIQAALADAAIPCSDIAYVETHGTGTLLGDPIEFRALTRAHQAAGGAAEGCVLGSIKANVGHLDACAGVIGTIKTALVLDHQTIPPQINFTDPNPNVPLERTGYRINVKPLTADRPILAAAVSSFGIGGTNVHAILTASPLAGDDRPEPVDQAYRLVVSARTRSALSRAARALVDHLREEPTRIDDLAHTLVAGRTPFAEELVFDAHSSEEAADILDRFATTGDNPPSAGEGHPAPSTARKVALPTYPFETSSYWIAPDVTSPEESSKIGADRHQDDSSAGDDVDKFILDTVKHLLDAKDLGVDSDFYDAGGESIAIVELVTAIRDRYNIELEFESFDGLRTIADMQNHVRTVITGGAPTDRVTITIAHGDGPHFFFVPPAGGTNFCYQRLAKHLHDTCSITAFTAPAADGDLTIRALARRNIEALLKIQPEGPFRLGGYSFGGNVAFEMAIQLQAAGHDVADVYMFDSHPPEAYLGDDLEEKEFLTALPQVITSAIPGTTIDPDRPIGSLHDLPAALLNHDSELLAISEQDMIRFAETWRQNHNALKHHYPDAKFSGRLTILSATEPHPQAELDSLRVRAVGKDAWRSHTSGDMRVVDVPGNHYTMFTDASLVPCVAATFAELVCA
jgi:phthiocerol/phenolphthiocerol synthesis type-I polyketide synthase E